MSDWRRLDDFFPSEAVANKNADCLWKRLFTHNSVRQVVERKSMGCNAG